MNSVSLCHLEKPSLLRHTYTHHRKTHTFTPMCKNGNYMWEEKKTVSIMINQVGGGVTWLIARFLGERKKISPLCVCSCTCYVVRTNLHFTCKVRTLCLDLVLRLRVRTELRLGSGLGVVHVNESLQGGRGRERVHRQNGSVSTGVKFHTEERQPVG